MTESQSKLAGLARFIFSTPSWYQSLGFAILIAAMTGIAAFDSGEAAGTWRGLFFLGRDAWEGIFFIGVPTIVASFLTAGVDRYVGGKLTPNRSSLLAVFCELIVVVFLVVAGVVAAVTPLGQTFVYDALVIALASIFALRLLVIISVSRTPMLTATIPASIQTLASAVLLFVYSGTLRFMEIGGPLLQAYLLPYFARADRAPPELHAIGPNHFMLLAATSVVYAASVYVFILGIDRPWRRSLGVSPLDFLRGFLGHIAEGSRELEDFFEQLGEKAIVPVTVLSFRRVGGDEKARFVLPMIHPGPMGEIGGGNLPTSVAQDADGLAFPPHATAGHDFNLVTEHEVDSLLDAVDRAMDRVEYTPDATVGVRSAAGEANVLAQGFGDDALLVNTFSPAFADDVEYGVGLSAAAEARTAGLDEVMLVDAHNCNNGLDGPDLGHVTPGSRRSFDMIEAAGLAGERVVDAARGDLRLGTAWDPTDWEPEDGIGPLGIRVAVTEVDGRTTAYVLVDGNNMEPGLRERIVESFRHDADDARPETERPLAADGAEPVSVDEIEVMTTDTHIVNTVQADNQVGAALDDDELVSTIDDLIAAALDDLEPVEAGLAVERAEVTVFGNDRTETLASHANVAVSMGGALAGAVILAAMAISVLLFFLTP